MAPRPGGCPSAPGSLITGPERISRLGACFHAAEVVSTGGYLGGVAFALPTLAASVGAGALSVRRRWDYLTGLPRGLALAVTATLALVWAYLLPLILGILTRGTVLAAAALAVAAAWALPRSLEPARRDPRIRPPASGPFWSTLAILAVSSLAVYELAQLRPLITQPVTDIDLLGFHLPGVARFIQTGTVWQVDQFLPGFATAQYPNNGEMLMLAFVAPWHDLAFARIPGIVFFAVTGAGVYALALELGATRAGAAIFGAVALAVEPLSNFALSGLLDDITLAGLAIGLVFLVRYTRTRRRGELALAGLALGLSLGTKWFGLTASAVVVLVWLAATAIARQPLVRIARDTGLLLATMAAGGGFWLVRNIVESGNPLYPKPISVFGVQLFAGSRGDVIDRFGYSIVNYLGHPGILRRFIYPGFKTQLGIAGLVLAAGVVIALLQWLLRRHDPSTLLLLALALVTIGICITYVITPGTAYGPKNDPIEGPVTLRWLMPAVVTGAALTAAVATRLGRWGWVLVLAGLVALGNAIRRGPPVSASSVLLAVAILAAAAVIVVVARGGGAIRRARDALRSRRRPVAGMSLGVVLLALVALLVLARADQRRVDSHTYAGYDPVFAWIDANAPSGHRVGLTGSTGATPGLAPTLPLFGPRLGNVVIYVGQRVAHSVELPATQTAFVRELRGGRFDLLAIGLPYAGATDRWARGLGFRLLARSNRIALYRVPPSIRG
jgi:hypothetical protein